jgi:hypothetical protein
MESGNIVGGKSPGDSVIPPRLIDSIFVNYYTAHIWKAN